MPRPKRSDKNNESASSAEKGTKPGYLRKTYIVDATLTEKIEAIAYWDRRAIREVVEDAFTDKVKQYEKKHGAVKPIPKR